ncbi:MAG: hypothetical protein QXT67_08100 [Candidatus Bathyarchaeia archaeon]
MCSAILWGIRHKHLAIKIYTILCIIWLIILVMAAISHISLRPTLEGIGGGVATVIILGLPPIAVIAYLKRREEKRLKKVGVDPYLLSAREKVIAMEKYFKGETSVSWSPIITLAHDALLSALQRMVIDLKGSDGVSMIEQLRREKKLYLSTLSRILKDSDVISEREMMDLEILRDLRNRIVHEDYHPSREQAQWALNLAKTFLKKHYPQLEI